MNRKLVNGLLLVALASSGCGMFTSCKDTDEDFKTDIEFGQEALAQRLKALEDKLAGFPDNYALKQEVINALNNKADKAVVEDLEKRVAYVLANLDERINNLITDIILQQTWNPMFGSINLPVGLSSTAVVNYYGENKGQAFTFPGEDGVEVNGEASGLADIPTPKKTFSVPSGVYMNTNDEGKGSLGMLYVSLNPTDIDPSNVTFSLVNSKGDKEITDIELTASEKELMFGKQTRDASANGFYETEILIDPADAETYKIKIEENLKSAMKDALKSHTKSDFATLAKVLYDQIQDVTPAYALKATWSTNPTAWIEAGDETKETVDWKNGYNYTYVSEVNTELPGDDAKKVNTYIGKYEIAAATVKPLGYKFGEDLGTSKKLPTFGSIEEAVNNALKDLNVEIDPSKVNFNGEGMEIVIDLSGIEIDGKKPEPSTVTLKYDKNSGEVASSNDDALNPLVAQINKALKDVVGQINGSVKESIESIKNSLVGKASKFDGLVSKYNSLANRINNFLANPNHYLQVMMAYQGQDGQLHQMSSNKAFPTVLTKGDGAYQLYLTSYTAEIIAPSCKKYVAVTKGAAKDDINGLDDFNTVLPGNQQAVTLDASKLTAGDYEIVYSSLDYQGYTSTRKFYFTVK